MALGGGFRVLKPLDLQTVLPRSVDIQRMQQIQYAQPVIDQQEVTREVVKRNQLKQEQIQNNQATAETNPIRTNENNPQNRERRYRRFRQTRQGASQESESKTPAEPERGQHIDIKF